MLKCKMETVCIYSHFISSFHRLYLLQTFLTVKVRTKHSSEQDLMYFLSLFDIFPSNTETCGVTTQSTWLWMWLGVARNLLTWYHFTLHSLNTAESLLSIYARMWYRQFSTIQWKEVPHKNLRTTLPRSMRFTIPVLTSRVTQSN